MLCMCFSWTEIDIEQWQRLMFKCGSEMTTLFNIDVTTKMHRLMRHADHHLIHLGCIRRCSSEQNEMVHKEVKIIYNITNKHIDDIASLLLMTWVKLPGASYYSPLYSP